MPACDILQFGQGQQKKAPVWLIPHVNRLIGNRYQDWK